MSAIFCASTAHATLLFSVQFSNAFGDGVLGGIADEMNSTSSGLTWGILVAETGSDFSGILNDVGLSADDGAELGAGYRYFNGGLTTNIPTGTDPQAGAITNSRTIIMTDYQPNYDTGDSFALIWFERGFIEGDAVTFGTNYGILENANFLVPSNSASNEPFGSNFNGTDPIRSANLAVIPEPSTALLGLLGLAGLLRRKR